MKSWWINIKKLDKAKQFLILEVQASMFTEVSL